MDKTPSAFLPDSGPPPTDSGLAALVLVARLHGLATDPDTLRHRHGSGDGPLDAAALVRAARDTGLRARLRSATDDGLDTLPLPALAETRAGGWLVLARVSAERVLVQETGATQPRIMARAEFLATWSGRLLLLARRGAGAASTRFGIGWFLRAAWPYRRILAEGKFTRFVAERYASFDTGYGRAIEKRHTNFRELNKLVLTKLGEPKPRSGKQEYLENLLNTYLHG